jgi:cell division protein FtsB
MYSRRFDLSVTAVCFALLGYFAWHANQGPRGYDYHTSLDQKVAVLQQEFDAAQQQRVRLEHKVGLMRPDSIDPDMLDELARQELEVAQPNELILFRNN